MRKIFTSSLLAGALLASLGASAQVLPQPRKATPNPAVIGKMKSYDKSRIVTKINPMEASESDYRLNESFERDDIYDNTLPEGWTTKVPDDMESMWIPYFTGRIGLASPDGYFSAMAHCWKLHDEAWLYSPEFTVESGDELRYQLYFDVRALYVWDDTNVDTEDGLILNRINAENLITYISVDGGEWEELYNLWDVYGKLGYWDIIYDYEYPEFRQININIDKYVGKKVKIGFCHSYTNEKSGYGMYLDQVMVAPPALTAHYDNPYTLLYFGYTTDIDYMPFYALAPYNTDIYWNADWVDGADYSWSYIDYVSETETTGNEDYFVTNYKPDYSIDPESSMTAYTYPTMTVSKPGSTPGTYTYGNGYGAVIAGGAAAMATKDGGSINFGLQTFDTADEIYTVNADFDVPAWGHNAMTQEWWTKHFFEGQESEPTDKDVVKIVNIMNFFYASGAPMVVNGVRVLGLGRFDDDVEFTMELIRLNDDFVPETVTASAHLLGSEVSKDPETDYPYDMCVFDFKFDNPVVVDYNMVTCFSGFDVDEVEYFAPFQSMYPTNMCYGWAGEYIYAPSVQANAQPGINMIPIYMFEGGFGEAMNSFAMTLDAEYPFIFGDEHEFNASTAGESKTFSLQSWYDAEKLTVKADTPTGAIPSWINVQKSGRLANAKVTITADAAPEDAAECLLTLEAPGVSYDITVKQSAKQAGIDNVTADSEVVDIELYNLTGVRVDNDSKNGVFLRKTYYANGTVKVEKVVK